MYLHRIGEKTAHGCSCIEDHTPSWPPWRSLRDEPPDPGATYVYQCIDQYLRPIHSVLRFWLNGKCSTEHSQCHRHLITIAVVSSRPAVKGTPVRFRVFIDGQAPDAAGGTDFEAYSFTFG
jgi:hypothetical protein